MITATGLGQVQVAGQEVLVLSTDLCWPPTRQYRCG